MHSLGRGLVEDPLSLSNEMRCRAAVPRSATLSDKLCEMGGARGVDVCATRPSSGAEGGSTPLSAFKLLPLLAGRPIVERLAGDARRRAGRSMSLSELVR